MLYTIQNTQCLLHGNKTNTSKQTFLMDADCPRVELIHVCDAKDIQHEVACSIQYIVLNTSRKINDRFLFTSPGFGIIFLTQ